MRDLASHRLKRTMRGALAAAVVIAAVGLTPAPASADPNPTTAASDPVTQFKQLSQQADQLNEKYNAAKADQQVKLAQLQQANNDFGQAQQVEQQAQAQENQFLVQVDQFAAASFEGAQLTSLSALLTGTSAQDFLERASILQDLASTNADALSKYTSAVDAAQAAAQRAQHDQQQAQDATNAANALIAQIQQQYQALQTQMSQLQSSLGKLTSAERAEIEGVSDNGVFIAPPGVAGAAMEAALGERGIEYVWGGASPRGFDCSGLVMWSYEQVGGPSLPHSADAQSKIGEYVTRSQLQPGDLVFFGSSSFIHHVGIYVGNGEMVDAPDFGQTVKVEPLDSDFAWGRRLGG